MWAVGPPKDTNPKRKKVFPIKVLFIKIQTLI